MVNQLGKLIPRLAERDKPLRNLLSKKNHWFWGVDQNKAFDSLKEELTHISLFALNDPKKDIHVSADTTSFGLGAVLLQKWGGDWRPVVYDSLKSNRDMLR